MQNLKEEVRKIRESKILMGVLYGIGGFLIVIIIFAAGVNVGFRKASFVENWSEHYNENFGMGRNDMFGGKEMPMMGFSPNAHGAIGKIIKIELPNVIVEDKYNTEKVILLKDDTQIEKASDQIKTSDLKLDDFVVIIGTPDEQGVIEAKLIRVIPSPALLD